MAASASSSGQRLCRALAEEMAENGFAQTSVQDVLKRAGEPARRLWYAGAFKEPGDGLSFG